MPSKSKAHVNAFSLEHDLYTELCRIAKEEERSIGGQIRFMLKRELSYAVRERKRREYHADET